MVKPLRKDTYSVYFLTVWNFANLSLNQKSFGTLFFTWLVWLCKYFYRAQMQFD